MATENGTYYYEFIIWFSDCPRVMMIVCVIVVYLVMSWRESKNKGEKENLHCSRHAVLRVSNSFDDSQSRSIYTSMAC